MSTTTLPSRSSTAALIRDTLQDVVVGADASSMVRFGRAWSRRRQRNGLYAVKQALDLAAWFETSRLTWFEEPVYHQDVHRLAAVRERAASTMEIAVREYDGLCQSALVPLSTHCAPYKV